MRSCISTLSLFSLVAMAGCGQAPGGSPSPSPAPKESLGTSAVTDNPRAVVATGEEPFNPFGYPNPFGMPQGGTFNSFGTVECPGGEPTGDPTDPCSEGSRIKMRGWSYTTRLEANDARLSGSVTVTGSANLDSTGAGREWGTWSEVPDSGGEAQGNFQDDRTVAANGDPRCLGVSPCWIDQVTGVGMGSDGTQYRISITFVAMQKAPLFFDGSVTGVLIPPP